MSSVKEIESAITALPPQQIMELHSWFDKFAPQVVQRSSPRISVERLRSQYADAHVRADAEQVNDQFPGSEEA